MGRSPNPVRPACQPQFNQCRGGEEPASASSGLEAGLSEGSVLGDPANGGHRGPRSPQGAVFPQVRCCGDAPGLAAPNTDTPMPAGPGAPWKTGPGAPPTPYSNPLHPSPAPHPQPSTPPPAAPSTLPTSRGTSLLSSFLWFQLGLVGGVGFRVPRSRPSPTQAPGSPRSPPAHHPRAPSSAPAAELPWLPGTSGTFLQQLSLSFSLLSLLSLSGFYFTFFFFSF